MVSSDKVVATNKGTWKGSNFKSHYEKEKEKS